MTLGEGIAFGGVVVSFLAFVLKFSNDEANKRSRIYDRMDEVKQDMEEKLQSKEVCDIHITNIDNTLQEIKADVKTLLKKNGY